jgi:lipopolysaccharide-induced tumor necrosis factor-alpha factor
MAEKTTVATPPGYAPPYGVPNQPPPQPQYGQPEAPPPGQYPAPPQQAYGIQPQYTGGQPPYGSQPQLYQGVQPQMTGYGPGSPVTPMAMEQRGFPQQPQGPPMNNPSQFQNALPLSVLGQGAAPVDCPMCKKRALTQINTEVGNTTHVWALAFCLAFCLGCIPYMITSTMDIRHNCSSCGALLATWHRSGRTVVHAYH